MYKKDTKLAKISCHCVPLGTLLSYLAQYKRKFTFFAFHRFHGFRCAADTKCLVSA